MFNYDKDFLKVSEQLAFTNEERVELYSLIEEILSHERWKDMQKYRHHLDSRAIHCLQVCCVSWRIAKSIKGCDAKSVAIGALLHDFFLYDWQSKDHKFNSLDIKLKVYSPRLHGFIHPLISYDNANKYFPHLMNRKIKNIIEKHMWPLTITPPRYREAWIVCMTDKRCSINVLKSPLELPKYIGIKK